MTKTSKTKINRRMRQKTNTFLAESIFLAKKAGLVELANELAKPTRIQANVNVGKIQSSKAEVIIVPGKVLSLGEIKRKVKVYALNFSEEAEKKLAAAGCEHKTILEALRKGEKLKGEFLR